MKRNSIRLAVEIKCYNSFEVITGFPRPFNQKTRFKAQFHAIVSLVEKTLISANKQGRTKRKLLHVKMLSGAMYAIGARAREPFR